ncbi:DUF3987 domain-containing protein [Kitasatospora sp. NPDC056181]|uniref:DUF3987 domain-containing protein n=1 Tax=Kitasatospora sp. NPDC056181 TaxID=3345737 RepID=UPI0035DDBC19
MTMDPEFESYDNVRPLHGTAPSAPPHDMAAEQAVLGALLLNPAALGDVTAVMDVADYYRPAHETIHRAIQDLGENADPITLTDALRRSGDLTRVGGPGYIHTLVNAVPTAANAEYYGAIVREMAKRRRLIEAGTRLVQAANEPGTDADVLRAALAVPAEPEPMAWPDPVPLTAVRHLPDFPLHALPGWLRDFVAGVAEESQTPPDMAGTLALAVLATAAGGRAVVQIRGRWREPVNLFTVVALPPANRKSAVFSAMTGPLYDAEKALEAAASGRIVEAELTARLAREVAETAAMKAAKADGPEKDQLVAEAIGLAQTAENITVPPHPRLLVDDATPEAITTLLAEQGGRLSVMSAEGGIFDIIAGRYSGTPNLEVFLKGHAGDRLRVDRRSRQEFIEAPALTMGLAVQPSVLEDIAKVRGFDGRGLLARFLYCLPVSMVGTRRIITDPVPPAVSEAYERNITSLTLALADWTDPAVLQLTPGADALLIAFQERLEPQLAARGGTLGHVAKWAGKLAGTVARIAGLLHLAAHLTDGHIKPVTEATMAAAVELGDYFTAHALSVFEAMGADSTVTRAASVLDVCRDNRWRTVSRRDLFTKLSRGDFPTAADLDPALVLLEEHGFIRLEAAPPRPRGRGRKPSPRYEIHPALSGDE